MTKWDTILETHGAPIKSSKESIIYQILAEKYTQKQFDQITQYSMPNFVWEVQGTDQIMTPDYIAKGQMTTMQEYLNTGRQHFVSLDLDEPGSLATDIYRIFNLLWKVLFCSQRVDFRCSYKFNFK